MVIAAGRLDEVVPLEPATMPGRVVVQWDKDDCAELGIVKVDLLGLGMMAVLQEADPLVRETGGEVDLAHLPPDDPEVYAMLQRPTRSASSRSRAARRWPRCRASAPSASTTWWSRWRSSAPGPSWATWCIPTSAGARAASRSRTRIRASSRSCERTLGVPLFQEQLLRMAMVAAGFTGGEAEELRRAMGFKRSSERMAEVETKLRAGMARAASPAARRGDRARHHLVRALRLSRVARGELRAARLRERVPQAHHPAAFYAALLNNQPMGFYHPATLVKDAQRHGVRVRADRRRRARRGCAR